MTVHITGEYLASVFILIYTDSATPWATPKSCLHSHAACMSLVSYVMSTVDTIFSDLPGGHDHELIVVKAGEQEHASKPRSSVLLRGLPISV